MLQPNLTIPTAYTQVSAPVEPLPNGLYYVRVNSLTRKVTSSGKDSIRWAFTIAENAQYPAGSHLGEMLYKTHLLSEPKFITWALQDFEKIGLGGLALETILANLNLFEDGYTVIRTKRTSEGYINVTFPVTR